MSYQNGYTTTPEVRAMKDELRNLKVQAKRLIKMSLPYTDTIAYPKFPKELVYLNDTIFYLFDRIDKLGLKIRRERNRIAEEFPEKNRKANDLRDFSEAIKLHLNVGDAITHQRPDGVVYLYQGFDYLKIASVRDEHSGPQNSCLAIRDSASTETVHKLIKTIERKGNMKMAETLRKCFNDVQIDEDTNTPFLILQSVKHTHKLDVKHFIVYFNYKNIE